RRDRRQIDRLGRREAIAGEARRDHHRTGCQYMSDVLARIVAGKREEVARALQSRPWGDVERAASEATPPRGFIAALERAAQSGRFGLIAEIKKASPSAGLIRPDFDPPVLAR